MQLTITETRVQTQTVLKLKPPLVERISILAEKLKAYEWLQNFKTEFPTYTHGRNEDISLALCLLLVEVIEPAIDSTKEESLEEKALFECEDELRKILEETLPEGEKLDNFLSEFNLFNDEKKEIFAQISIADRVMKVALDRFYQQADKAHDDFFNRVNALRNRIKEHNKIHDPKAVFAVNQEMLAIIDKFEAMNFEFKNIGHIKDSLLATCKRAQDQVRKI